MQTLKAKWGTSTTALGKVIAGIPVHIGRWRIFRNKYVLRHCLTTGRETDGFFKPTPLALVKKCPVLKQALIEIAKKSS